MCYLQEPTFDMEPPKKEKKSKKNQRLTSKKARKSGLEVIETVEEAPIVQTAKEFHFPYEKMKRENEYQFISDKTEPQVIVNENAQPSFEQGLLPSYEDMMCEDVFNGPSSMETQPDLAPVKVLEEGVAVTQGGRTVEWWPIERPLDLPKQPHLAPVHIMEEGVAVTQDGRQVEW